MSNNGVSNRIAPDGLNYPRAERVANCCLFGGIALAATAALVAWLASRDASIYAFSQTLVDVLSFIPARRWAERSDYPELASIYYLIVSPLIVVTLVGCIAKFGFPIKHRFPVNVEMGTRVKAILASLFFGAVGPVVLALLHGADWRYFHWGTNFAELMAFGWVLFACIGMAIATGLIGLHASFFPRRWAFLRSDKMR